MKTFSRLESDFFTNGYHYIAGVDEAGRGPLAGPVVAGAVIFPRGTCIDGVDDCKKLLPEKREELSRYIKEKALNWAIGIAEVDEIDSLNIYWASQLAIKRAVNLLVLQPDICLADGLPIKNWNRLHKAIVKGDSLCFSIAAASILAKVHRDRIMVDLHNRYPQYLFDKNKGYSTPEHRRAIMQYGICPVHRMSFKHEWDD